MTSETEIRKSWIKWGLFLAFWTLVGAFFSTQYYLTGFKTGRPILWRQALAFSLGDWYVWAVLSLAVAWLARRFRLSLRHGGLHWWIHLLAGIGASYAHMFLRAWVAQVQSWLSDVPVSFGEALAPLVLQFFYLNLVVYWSLVTAVHALDYFRQYQERELRTAELERRLIEARLQALQMQLNPHFLFNTLHAISSLMHKDVESADRMIARLSELLRYTLESTEAQEVPLEQEIDFLKRYLEIEQARFGERLQVRLELAPDSLAASVPNLILQPILENAIRHGVEPHARPGLIELRSRCEQDQLVIEVQDNGRGLAGATPDEGVGLSNTRARLAGLYGRAGRLDFQHPEAGGLLVIIALPYRIVPNRRANRLGP